MKRSVYKSLLLFYSVLFVISALVGLSGILLVLHVITSVDPNGNVVKSDWAQQYTDDFPQYFKLNGDVPEVSKTGIQSLDSNQLWIQILDGYGREIYAHNTTSGQPEHYSPIDFLDLTQGGGSSQSEDSTGETVCAGQVATDTGQWTYIIGFPMNITKVTMFLNGASFTGGRTITVMIMSAAAVFMLLAGGVFSVWVIRHMQNMTQAIGRISCRKYEPIQRKGPFEEVYSSLNEMNDALLKGDKELAQNEIAREEWITNITHDLKTPLSPIRGYAELLADPDNTLAADSRIRYGRIILRNTDYAEKLVNDLKLTYQLKNNMLPLDKRRLNLSRFLKELVIDILNHHDYTDRMIGFDTDNEALYFDFDQMLLKRAIDNIIYNALIHNPRDTEIHVFLRSEECITVAITDNGNGMNAEATARLFERYYRGTNTAVNTGGTGLGMAITRQIIEIHGGSIRASSEIGRGTNIIIDLPHTS